MQSNLFKVKEFKDVEFMTAEGKRKVLKDWERFLNNGCQWKDFSKRLRSKRNQQKNS